MRQYSAKERRVCASSTILPAAARECARAMSESAFTSPTVLASESTQEHAWQEAVAHAFSCSSAMLPTVCQADVAGRGMWFSPAQAEAGREEALLCLGRCQSQRMIGRDRSRQQGKAAPLGGGEGRELPRGMCRQLMHDGEVAAAAAGGGSAPVLLSFLLISHVVVLRTPSLPPARYLHLPACPSA